MNGITINLRSQSVDLVEEMEKKRHISLAGEEVVSRLDRMVRDQLGIPRSLVHNVPCLLGARDQRQDKHIQGIFSVRIEDDIDGAEDG